MTFFLLLPFALGIVAYVSFLANDNLILDIKDALILFMTDLTGNSSYGVVITIIMAVALMLAAYRIISAAN